MRAIKCIYKLLISLQSNLSNILGLLRRPFSPPRNDSCKLYKILSLSLAVVLSFYITTGFCKTKKAPPVQPPNPPQVKFVPYNRFPGNQEINLFGIEKKRQIRSIGVISPDMERVAYSEVYLYPQDVQTSSRLYYINADVQKLEDINVTLPPEELVDVFALKKPDNPGEEILEVGTDGFDQDLFKTLTIVDWSSDSRKLLLKETTGEHFRGIWHTNVWVYDFGIKKARKLDEIRKAIVFYWKIRYKIDLVDYRWDIVPLGWDNTNPDMIVVNAYGYNNDGKEFLGCWGIDFRGKRSLLLSLDKQNWPVQQNGLIIGK